MMSQSVTDYIHDGSPTIGLKNSYYLVTSQPLKHCNAAHYSHVWGDAGENKPTVIPFI